MKIENRKLKNGCSNTGCCFRQFTIYNLQFAIFNIFCWLFLAAAVAADVAADARKAVVPFDFASTFDDGRYGRLVGEMIWKKLSAQGGYVVPETMDDVRDYCAGRHVKPSPETDLDQMRKLVVEGFDAQIGIWGGVERVAGAELDAYDLTIKCVDFSARPTPKAIYQVQARTKSVSEIPHLYVRQMLDALGDRRPAAAAGANPLAEENWRQKPNLVAGDFQRGAAGVPRGWQKVCGQRREPLGKLVQWTTEEGNAQNKVIRFTLDRETAENEGLMYYSEDFPVEEGATYRFQCRWRSHGPAVKVFVKCYDAEASPYDAEDGAAAKTGQSQRREVYRSQQNLSSGPVDTWTWSTQVEDFTPRHVKYSPRWGRVMLYAYAKPGEVEFDDVVVKQIAPPSPGERAKVRRPSRETKITIEEMEKNYRRGGDVQRQKN